MPNDESTWLSIDPFAATGPGEQLSADPRRYRALDLLGAGATGEVYRVVDRVLERPVAMKVLRADRVVPLLRDRFAAEARVVGRLHHPGLPPVHELGELEDGRPYFTMGLVEGRTLGVVADEVHGAGLDGPGLRRLVTAFGRACDAVAFAHTRGVVHRDLKPANIMVGDFGEVFVVDWGLARHEQDDALAGVVAGTPRYMAPEQAVGAEVLPTTDVYALGATLYHLLVGAPPYADVATQDVLAAVRDRPPVPVEDLAPGAPEDLVRLVASAMARDPAGRPESAAPVADHVRAWLEGVRQRDRALGIVQRARALQQEADDLERRATDQQTRADRALAQVSPAAPEAERHAGWALEDAARVDRQQARQLRARAEALLEASLTHAPDLVAAHRAIAELARAELEGCTRAGDQVGVEIAHERLERHLAHLPAGPEADAHRRWLRRSGRVVLHTVPSGARVVARPLELRGRRLIEGDPVDLGTTPLDASLSLGSWVLELRAEGHAPVRYPVWLERGRDWTGVAPGEAVPRPIPLLPDLPDGEVYVPAGWFVAGGAPHRDGRTAVHRWAEGFVIQRDLVTNAEYVAFLDDLVRQGREDEALCHQPRERGVADVDGAAVYGRSEAGGFVLVPDADGHVWRPRAPVVNITWDAAVAYARWWAERTGLPWRVPAHLEWEKAARGVDARIRPWGSEHVASRACMFDTPRDEAGPADVGTFPLDISVYGMRDPAGNARCWCADGYGPDPDPPAVSPIPVTDDQRITRGGCWNGSNNITDLRIRWRDRQTTHIADVGFRLVRSL